MIKIIAGIFFVIIVPQLIGANILTYILDFKMTIVYTLMANFLSYSTCLAVLSFIGLEVFLGLYNFFK